ncbi:MAG: spermidine/putrescine ABC transporter permease [Litorilinea sp.]|nr:MAG: spermidine/putrescine ABC transporter permease [Litorilinea sp.]
MTTITETRPGEKGARARLRRPSRRQIRDNLTGYLFFAPWMINLILLNAFPIGAAIYYSFTEYSVLQAPRWIGLGNYHEMFFVDELFWTAIYNTVYYCLFAVPLGLALSLFLAVLLNYRIRGISFFRTTFFLPSIVPAVAASIVWAWILHPEYGLINDLLARVGIPGPPWLTSEIWSKPAFILMSLWGIGPTTIIFLAGLQDIPAHLYEAAEIDGANSFQRFRHVTVPMLTPTIFFNLVIGLIGAFQIFTQVYIISEGGPLWSTLFYVYYLYRHGFQYFNMGYASALALVLFAIILILTLIVLATSKRWVYYEGAELR